MSDPTPDDIIAFWFPEPADADPETLVRFWTWRMRGGAHQAVIDRWSDVTTGAASGALDAWADTPNGRFGLIIVLDQFSRSVWAGTPQAYAQDEAALRLCLDGLGNGHFAALDHPSYKLAYKTPLEHCEGPDHLAHLDLAIRIVEDVACEVPESLAKMYRMAAEQPRKHRAVIADFGRFPHRNAILGRVSTANEEVYLAKGEFPHQTDLSFVLRG